jgi:hypothetical protein
MHKSNHSASSAHSSKLSHVLNGMELIEATLFDNVSGGGKGDILKSPSERCRMG